MSDISVIALSATSADFAVSPFKLCNNDAENDGTDSNGQEVTYTGISTTHKFTKTGKTAKAINVDLSKDLADVSTFFDTVTTIDTLKAKA